MAIDFPNSPTDGDTFTVGYKTWQYIAAKDKWVSAGGTIGPTGPTGPIGPTGPAGAGSQLDDSGNIIANQVFS